MMTEFLTWNTYHGSKNLFMTLHQIIWDPLVIFAVFGTMLLFETITAHIIYKITKKGCTIFDW